MIATDTNFVERVREYADREAGDNIDAELNFYVAAIVLGASPAQAERIDEILTVRVMRARGAI